MILNWRFTMRGNDYAITKRDGTSIFYEPMGTGQIWHKPKKMHVEVFILMVRHGVCRVAELRG